VVEYEALVNNLCITAKLGVRWLYICEESKLVVNQVMGESNCHNSRMVMYRQEIRKLEEKFDGFELHHILRRDNEVGNALAWLRSSHEIAPPGVFAQHLFKPSIWLEEDISVPMPGI
jgi:ribonuclease HI